MTPNKINKIFNRLQQANPSPTTELEYNSNFELLIAVILSAQATDVSVNKATKELFKIAKTPEQFIELGEEGLKTYIKTIGLYNSKAANIIKACRLLITQHNSQIPINREDLQALPGVGRKTANVVLNTAFGHETIAVDTHVFRVANRIGLTNAKTPLAVELELEKVIPSGYRRDAHHWLILHGRYVCKARQPNCGDCVISDLCEYPNKCL